MVQRDSAGRHSPCGVANGPIHTHFLLARGRGKSPDVDRPRRGEAGAKLIGVEPVDGGVHPRFGTRNIIFPLADERYLEVVECLDHPASDKAPFGQAVKARSEAGDIKVHARK